MQISGIRIILSVFLLFAVTFDAVAQNKQFDTVPLTRVREGGTPYNPNQSLVPYAIHPPASSRSTSGIVASPPEYEPIKGVLYKYASGQWTSIVTAMVAELTGDPSHDEIAYVVVTSTSQRATATSDFISAGADMSKVEFLIHPSESIWMRDYGPHFVWIDGTLTIADSHYYPTRPLDNFQPTIIGDQHLGMYTEDMGLYFSGGNFQPGPNRSAFVTSLVNLDNPASEGFNETMIRDLYQKYQGTDTLHILPQLPTSVDGTGHIDMWMYIIDEDTVIISEFKPGSNSTAINVTNNAVTYMESLGFEVFRPQAWNSGNTHYTYANAYRVNDRIFVPVYGNQIVPGGLSSYNDEDAFAMSVWQQAAGPDIEIVPIQCIDIIWASGAIHCIVKQVPRYTDSSPAASVLSPSAGDVLIGNSTHKIKWTATDTDNVTVPLVDLFYSPDNGATWNFIDSTTNTGSYDWQVPNQTAGRALIRVVATSSDSDIAIAVSENFKTAVGNEVEYTFGTNVGVDRWAFGTTTTNWGQISGDPTPVSNQLSTANYGRLASSNATGGDSDSGRYISPYPGSSGESTHVFQFKISEDRHDVDELIMRWEGYADGCTQIELYVWDVEAQDWGDGRGLVGQNRYLDSFAGNEDGQLVGTLRSDICRYIESDGTIRFLVYGERSRDETFHDFASLTVKLDDSSLDHAEVTRGNLVSGGMEELSFSDNEDFSIKRDQSQIQAAIHLVATAAGKCEAPSSISVTLESSVFSRPTITQVIELRNFETGQYEVIDSRAARKFNDQVTIVDATGDLSRFVQPATGLVDIRVKYTAAANRTQFTANVDRIVLNVQ